MANNKIVVKTPRGQIVQTKNGTAKLEWNKEFGAEKTEQFSKAQKFLDSEVLRTTAPYVPFRTGTLMKSGQLGTVIGSGEVVYNSPYAARQYYSTAQSRPYDAQRGSMWFERSKADHKEEWIRGTKKIAGDG